MAEDDTSEEFGAVQHDWRTSMNEAPGRLQAADLQATGLLSVDPSGSLDAILATSRERLNRREELNARLRAVTSRRGRGRNSAGPALLQEECNDSLRQVSHSQLLVYIGNVWTIKNVSILGQVRRDVADQLEARGFATVWVEPDGNCLFRALSYSIYGRVQEHKKERRDVCSFMASAEGKRLFSHLHDGDNIYNQYIRYAWVVG